MHAPQRTHLTCAHNVPARRPPPRAGAHAGARRACACAATLQLHLQLQPNELGRRRHICGADTARSSRRVAPTRACPLQILVLALIGCCLMALGCIMYLYFRVKTGRSLLLPVCAAALTLNVLTPVVWSSAAHTIVLQSSFSGTILGWCVRMRTRVAATPLE
jgi:hypothetical protein